MKIKTIETNGITYIEPVPGATSEWYYGLNYAHGDLYEAEEFFNDWHKLDWEWSMFDPEQKKKRRETVFPQERKKAFEMGKTLAER